MWQRAGQGTVHPLPRDVDCDGLAHQLQPCARPQAATTNRSLDGTSMPTLNRRELIGTLAAGAAWTVTGCRDAGTREANAAPAQPRSITLPNGAVDWRAVRELFPLSKDALHFSTFLFVSQPKPVAEGVEHYRKLIDADTVWIERAAFDESEGHPFSAMKRSLAGYIGGSADELCLTSNATQALAMAYHGLRIRKDQEILTTEHDHYSQHESIRF